MIEVKFRGKRRDNGEWCYGLPKYNSAGIIGYICGWFGEKGVEQYDEVEVVPETVGQFTGAKDLNGVDLYVGDFVKYQYLKYRKPIVVVTPIEWAYFGFQLKRNETKLIDSRSLSLSHRQFERCGNIFDNPELLKP